MRSSIVALLLFVTPALAVDDPNGFHGQGHDEWHQEFYGKLVTPDTLVSCCNLADCRPTSGRAIGNHYEVKVNGKFVQVLPGKVVKKTAPDWGYHVCAPKEFDGKPEHVYCVVLPPEN